MPASEASQVTTATEKSAPARPLKGLLPYVAKGVAIFDDEPAAVSPPAKQMNVVRADFRQRVIAACGPKAHDVEVLTGQGKVVLKMRVNTEADEREVRDKVLRLPEMHSADMHLEIAIAPH